MSLQSVTNDFVGPDANIRFEDWTGATWGRLEAPVVVRFNRPEALRYLALRPGELGFGRAYVSGAMDIDGDIWTLLDLGRDLGGIRFNTQQIRDLLTLIGWTGLRHRPEPPPEELPHRSRFRAHSKRRDEESVSHHYDVSNHFYRLVLGPSLVYSCAVFEHPDDGLEQAQANKLELVCRKLGLQPGMRLLDVGCGWGSLALHAARHYDVDVVGITISQNQAELARQRVAGAGLGHRIEIRLQDYRDVDDGPYDAISSIGMLEHVGLANLKRYFETLRALLRPEGRLLNHQIGRKPLEPSRIRQPFRNAVARNGFINRYVFPDGELHEVGEVIAAMQETGFEVRHMESLREHYAMTLRRWVTNLENDWEVAVAEAGEGKARVWRLYMAATSVNFTNGHTQVHQILGTKTPLDGPGMGRSGMPLRYDWTDDLGHAGGRSTLDLRDLAPTSENQPMADSKS